MDDKTTFNAPWGTALKITTVLCFIILVGVPIINISSGLRENIGWILLMVVMPLAILVIASFFTIRGYLLTPETLFVQRLIWKSELDLSDLISVEADPTAMSKSIRTFGNGGMFCFAGYFRNKKLGSYRVFATDPRHSVILRFPNRTFVVTPGNPDEFVEKIRKLRNL